MYHVTSVEDAIQKIAGIHYVPKSKVTSVTVPFSKKEIEINIKLKEKTLHM